MPRAMMILPFENGSIQFPDLPQDANVSFCIISYAPPPAGTAPYCLAMIDTEQANIDSLRGEPNCLFMANVIRNEDGGQEFETEALAGPARNAIRLKVEAMGFTGAQYGLVNAAIQASQNRDELVYSLGKAAFFRDDAANHMEDKHIRGAGLG